MSMMDKMMEEVNMMGMMSKTTSGAKEMGMSMIPQMMMEMMPRCLKVMVLNILKEKRIDFILKMVTTLGEQGCAGMSEGEKEGLI
ncbi:MAG: hypothetical protein ACYS8Y_07420 [Planctomycetota bacterium]|jgi:hypothetical protein